MNMICGSIHKQRLASQPVNRAAQIGKQFGLYLRFEPRPGVFGAKQRVNQDVRVSVRQSAPRMNIDLISPLPGPLLASALFPTAPAVGHKTAPLAGLGVLHTSGRSCETIALTDDFSLLTPSLCGAASAEDRPCYSMKAMSAPTAPTVR